MRRENEDEEQLRLLTRNDEKCRFVKKKLDAWSILFLPVRFLWVTIIIIKVEMMFDVIQ